jgi:hypothetical protein
VKTRFQADNDLRRAIVRGVVRSEPRIDFVVVSHDFHTLPPHFRHFTRNRRSPGVLLIRQDLAAGKAVESLLLIWEASESDEWVNRFCVLPSLVTIAGGG